MPRPPPSRTCSLLTATSGRSSRSCRVRGGTPFAIGVFGAWGSRESTLLGLADAELESRHPDAFVRVHFNPWVHRQEDGMLVPLLHALHDMLDSDPRKGFVEAAKAPD
jgi:hypothetical protein